MFIKWRLSEKRIQKLRIRYTFDLEQNCIQANADSQGNIDMLEEFGEINSTGLSEVHFDIVRIGKEAIIYVYVP